jgi:hypothetical protein
MHPGRRRNAIALTLALFARLMQLAHADPAAPRAGAAPPPLTVQYSAPGNCPTESDFEARVQSRTALARFADEKDAQAVQVVVKPMGVTYAGHLSIVGRSGRVSERDVEDVLCADVVDALALVTALAVDPKAILSLASPPEATSAADALPLGAGAPEGVTVIPLIAPAPAQATPPVSAQPQTVSLAQPELDKSPAAAAPRRGIHVGATFVLMAGIAPDTLAGGGGFGEVESKAPGWLAPSGRLTVFAAENGALASRIASFLLVAGRLDFCPLRIGSREVSLRPCAAIDIGAVRAEGIDADPGHGVPGGEPWFDVAALLRARWAPGRGRFFVEVEGGIFVPLNRASFVYENPLKTIQTPWGVAPAGSLAMGVSL